MKKRNLMRRWYESHPLSSKRKAVRYAWLLATLPIQLILFPANAFFHGIIAFCTEFSEVIRHWIDSYIKAWIDASRIDGESDD